MPFSHSDTLSKTTFGHVDGRCKVAQRRNREMEHTIELEQQKIELLAICSSFIDSNNFKV